IELLEPLLSLGYGRLLFRLRGIQCDLDLAGGELPGEIIEIAGRLGLLVLEDPLLNVLPRPAPQELFVEGPGGADGDQGGEDKEGERMILALDRLAHEFFLEELLGNLPG